MWLLLEWRIRDPNENGNKSKGKLGEVGQDDLRKHHGPIQFLNLWTCDVGQVGQVMSRRSRLPLALSKNSFKETNRAYIKFLLHMDRRSRVDKSNRSETNLEAFETKDTKVSDNKTKQCNGRCEAEEGNKWEKKRLETFHRELQANFNASYILF